MLTIFGGKITTFRKLAEHALDKLSPYFPEMGDAWTSAQPLPGGDIENADFDAWFNNFNQKHPNLPATLLYHYARLYGTRADQLLANIQTTEQLGKHFGHTLYEVEVRYLVENEWAQTAEDILQRRTKHGLHLTPAEREVFTHWLDAEYPQANALSA